MTGGAADAGAAARSRAKAPKITDLVIGSPPRVQCLTHACAAGVGEEVDERARRRVVAADAKIASERAARDVELAVGAKRHGRGRIQTTGAERAPSGHQQAERRHGREIERLDGRGVVVEHVKTVVRGIDLHVPRAGVSERWY